MTEIVAADLGGTHARFAIAELEGENVVRLDPPVILRTAEHGSLRLAWQAFRERLGRSLPRAAGIAVAAPVEGAELKLTNTSWIVRPARIPEELDVDAHLLVNDFGAVAHAAARCGPEWFAHICGPDLPIAIARVVSVVGPGTGLGVALVVRDDGKARIVETEGGHIDFAALDPTEDAVLAHLRRRFGRVSAERIASGPGLANIYGALAAIEGQMLAVRDDASLWTAALNGSDALASAALDRFCLSLGAVVGDIALAQGGKAVVLAGGLAQRLAAHLPRSGFAARFIAKGRFEARMAAMPVKLITHPQPGLLGAALAFAAAQG